VHFGSVTATLTGFAVRGAMSQQGGCAGTFAGAGSVGLGGTELTAQFDGSDCHNTHSGGQLRLHR